jgi:hypothetical protein
MPPIILAQGLFPLTQEAADASLYAIDFVAAAVRGYDAIDVTDVVMPIWRRHLSYWYPQLPPVAQYWYAHAPQSLASIRAQWPLLNPAERATVVQMWAMNLPGMLWLVDPVLAEAQATEMDEAQLKQLDDMRGAAKPPEDMASAEAINELNRGMNNAIQMQNLTTTMVGNTLSLMSAMNRH